MSKELLIDGDALVYKAGFVSEEYYYDLYEMSKLKLSASTKAELLANMVDGEVYGIATRQEPKAFGFAKYNLDRMIEALKRKFKTDRIRIFLTDTSIINNFRWQTYKEYKQNRHSRPKPIHYSNLREYLVAVYGAEVVSGIEADDALGRAQTDDTIIVSHDKDLLQVPGLHYSLTYKKIIRVEDPGKLMLWKVNEHYRILGTGFKWFCAQMLLGDSVDNIPGVKGFGPYKVYHKLNKCKTNGECAEIINGIYKKHNLDLDVSASLLWIYRTNNANELWSDYL